MNTTDSFNQALSWTLTREQRKIALDYYRKTGKKIDYFDLINK